MSQAPRPQMAPLGHRNGHSNGNGHGSVTTPRRQQRPIAEGYENYTARIPPQDIEAEMSVIGAMLLIGASGEEACDAAEEMLTRVDFWQPANGEIFDAILAVRRLGKGLDIVTLRDELSRRGSLEMVGGLDHLRAMADFTPTTANLPYYAEIVRDKAILRRLIEAAGKIAGTAYDEAEDALAIAAQAEQTIFAATPAGATTGGARPVVPLREIIRVSMDALEEREKSGNSLTGIASGFSAWDKILLGLRPGDLHILAGRPSMGKSAAAQCIGRHAAGISEKSGRRLHVAYFSLEMMRERLIHRLQAAESGIPLKTILTGQGQLARDAAARGLSGPAYHGLSDYERARIEEANERLWDLSFSIDDTRGLSPSQIRAKCRRLRAQEGGDIDLVIIDHFHLMNPDPIPAGYGRRADSDQDEYSQMAKALQTMAREINVPVVLLAQLNRSVEKREDKRPVMSDLRGSGALEEVADSITFTYRPKYYERKESGEEETEQTVDEVQLLVEKNRDGETAFCRIGFMPTVMRMFTVAPEGLTPPGVSEGGMF